MEITEAFHPQCNMATGRVNSVGDDPLRSRGSPKQSPNCNGHPPGGRSSSIQVYRDGEISFIPLQERGIILHGK